MTIGKLDAESLDSRGVQRPTRTAAPRRPLRPHTLSDDALHDVAVAPCRAALVLSKNPPTSSFQKNPELLFQFTTNGTQGTHS
jgi:hypothetical protein